MKQINQGGAIRIGAISTSRLELRDIIKAWLAISLAFAILESGSLFSKGFIQLFTISGLTVGIGFIFHEMAHKITAQRFGCFAEFRSFDSMLLLAVLMSFFGFLFAAPGAVMISGPVGRRRNGKISAAGPLANLVIALLFGLLTLLSPGAFILMIARYGFMINTWLALFNMLPFWQFDGIKVFRWSRTAYFLIISAAVIFLMAEKIVF